MTIYSCPKEDCKHEGIPALNDVGPHTGLYCGKCGAFIKWANEKEVDKIMSALVACDKKNCKECNHIIAIIDNTMNNFTCGHPHYKGDEQCPLEKPLPKTCDCGDACTCVDGEGCGCTPCKDEATKAHLNSIPAELKDSAGVVRDDLNEILTTKIARLALKPDVNFAPQILSTPSAKQRQWDEYFMAMCDVVATNCKCYSRQIGAVIVKDRAVLSTGYNGPPRGVPPCYEKLNIASGLEPDEEPCCPRKKLGVASGTHLNLCYAQHAERNAITQAARNGTAVEGATLYLNDIIPCKDCLGAIINAGISEIVCTKLQYYDVDEQGRWLIDNSDIVVREVSDG